MRTTLARLVALGLILAACSPGDTEETTTTAGSTTVTTSAATTTAPSTTTTTTMLREDVSHINGLPVEDSGLIDRRVLGVKIDNHSNARPQSGIDRADMVVELMVEGITRFLTVWHQSDSDYLGPMRSARPTDRTLLQAFNEPTFAISGAQDWVQAVTVLAGVHMIGEVHPATWRISERRAPHNLYVNTRLLREHADSLGYPDLPPDGPIWDFGPMPSSADAVSSVRIDFSGNLVNWTWDEGAGTWLREVGGRPSNWRDQDKEVGQIAFPVLVVLRVRQYTAFPPKGFGGTSLPASRTKGAGKAFVFADGKVVEGTWHRQAETDWFLLTDANGESIMVPPGQAWVSLVPTTGGLIWE